MREIIKIIRYSRQLWRYYLAIAVMVVVLAGLALVVPFLTKFLVDGVVNKLNGQSVAFSYLIGLLVMMLLASVIVSLLNNVNGYVGDIMAVKLNSLLSRRYFEKLTQLPISYYDNEITGKITARLERSINTISNLMQAMSNNFVQFFLTTAVTLIVIAFYSWPVALLLVIIFPTYIWISHLSSRSWQKRQKDINTNIDLANGRFIESISQIRVIKSFVTELRELNFYKRKRVAIEEQTKVQSYHWHKYDIWRRLTLNIVFFAIYTIIFWQAYHGQYSIGVLTLLITLVNQAQFPLFSSSFVIDALQRAVADSRDYFSVMELEPAIVDQTNAVELKVRAAQIEYQGVSFGYDDKQTVLENISFTMTPGSKVALVGESGEGKSTIANLMLRFYDLGSGEILIDGQSVATVSQASLRRNIGVVFQEPQLFSGTIRENIAYARANASLSQIERSARVANAYDFIKKLPQGFDTQIGERGVKLSGGQKQRIAIARAILKDAPILILDEATSSLDSRAEHEVQEALEHLMHGRTTLIIAHRLSTIAGVDQVVGIRGGKVVEIGSPAELAKNDGIYAELLKLQTMPSSRATKAKLKKFELA